jgi:hypothetical protein
VDVGEKDPAQARVLAAAEMHLDAFEYALKQDEAFAEYQPFRTVVETYIKDMFRQSPVLSRYCEQRRGWYSEKLFKLLEESRAGK